MEGSIEHLIKGDVISVPFPFLKHSLSKSVVICQKLDIGAEMLTSK
jgi:hypothetical protein